MGFHCSPSLQSVVDGVVEGQGMALLVSSEVTVLGSTSARTFVAAAVSVPRIGRFVVVSVYIPPLRAGYAS